jgi:hypothetical protein
MRLALGALAATTTLITPLLLGGATPAAGQAEGTPAMQVQYLEIVTPEVEATCEALEKLHGVRFGADGSACARRCARTRSPSCAPTCS